MFDSPVKILLVDDNKLALELFSRTFGDEYTVITISDPREATNIIQSEPIALVIVDYMLPHLNGLDLLERVKAIDPNIRRIMISGELTIQNLMDAANRANTHLVMQKPWKKEILAPHLKKLIDEYKVRVQIIDELKEFRKTEQKKPQKSTDELISLLISISETGTQQDFSHQFVAALNGLRSLAFINYEFFLEQELESNFTGTLDYLTDMDIIANQFDQKILSMYVSLLKSHIYLIAGKFDEAKMFYEGSLAFREWYSELHIDLELLEIFEAYPVKFNPSNYDNGFTYHFKASIELQTKSLFKLKIEKLVNISDKLFKLYENELSDVFYMMIIRNEIPIYDHKGVGSELNVSLITGFVVALTNFLTEIIEGSGQIDIIKYETGVVAIHLHKEFTFVIFTKVNDVRHRVALRHLAFDIYDLIESIPQNTLVSKEEQAAIDKKFESYFGHIS